MPGDFVNEIYPSSRIRPVSPQPANVGEERKQGQKRRHREKGERHRKNADIDRVSLEKSRRRKPDRKKERKPLEKSSDNPAKKKTIDITV